MHTLRCDREGRSARAGRAASIDAAHPARGKTETFAASRDQGDDRCGDLGRQGRGEAAPRRRKRYELPCGGRPYAFQGCRDSRLDEWLYLFVPYLVVDETGLHG